MFEEAATDNYSYASVQLCLSSEMEDLLLIVHHLLPSKMSPENELHHLTHDPSTECQASKFSSRKHQANHDVFI